MFYSVRILANTETRFT